MSKRKKAAPKPDAEEDLPARSLAAPEHLPEAAKAEWEQIVRDSPSGHLARMDRAVLEVFVRTVTDWKAAVESLHSTGGAVIVVNNVPVRNPWTMVVNRLADLVAKLQSDLGLSPGARKRLKVESNNDAEDDLELLLSANDDGLTPRQVQRKRWLEFANKYPGSGGKTGQRLLKARGKR